MYVRFYLQKRNTTVRHSSVKLSLIIIHTELNINNAVNYHVNGYKQRRVIFDRIRSLLAGPDRSGLVALAADDYAEKDLICEFITRWYLINLRPS